MFSEGMSLQQEHSCQRPNRKRIKERRTRYFSFEAAMVILATCMHRFTATALSTIQFPKIKQTCIKMQAADSRRLRFYSAGNYGVLQQPLGTGATAIVEPILASLRSGNTDGKDIIRSAQQDMNLGNSRDLSLNSFSTKAFAAGSQPHFPKMGPDDLQLSDEEKELFDLLNKVSRETGLSSSLRVAGGWVRDKLLATPRFQKHPSKKPERLTSKYRTTNASVLPQASMGRKGTKVIVDESNQQPVDIDIALDDMLGREFADHLNEWLEQHGQETHSVGVVLKNPEKSKHLETATMKVGSFWIDFVNLRAEEYTQDSRIPDLMRIGTADEDAFRRDLTINALFYNINTGCVEDWTGRGFDDLQRGVVATPLAPLTTLLDDPLRVLRSIRFAARLRFTMDDSLVEAAKDERVRDALGQKVSRERIGGEVDLMLRSLDPVGAMRLLVNLHLVGTVFPIESVLLGGFPAGHSVGGGGRIFTEGFSLLSTAHDHLCDCQVNPPTWCETQQSMETSTFGVNEQMLMKDVEQRRLLWYAAFLKPLLDYSKLEKQSQFSTKQKGKKANRSVIQKVLVNELKRPTRDADGVERIMRAADDFTRLINSGCDLSAMAILMSDVRVEYSYRNGTAIDFTCMFDEQLVDSEVETHPIWVHAMEFRLLCSKVLLRVGSSWRAALFLSLSEQLVAINDEIDYAIEGDVVDEFHEEYHKGIIEKYDAFAIALQQMGLIGIWSQKPLIDGGKMKKILPNIPPGPVFREIMDEQENWITTHPGGREETLTEHLKQVFPEYI